MASYPASIVSFSAITSGVTVLQQSHFDDACGEVDAIEAELGVDVIGTAGSLVERLNMAFDEDGNARGLIQNFGAANGERRRMRCGKQAFRCEDLTSITHNLRGTVTFEPELAVPCFAFCTLELIGDDPADATIPCLVGMVQGSGTTTGFDFLVTNSSNDPPAATTSFILHWVAFETTLSFTDAGF